jgi:hypothetical protein
MVTMTGNPQAKPPLGAFRVGDHVAMAAHCVTNLGRGRIIDISTTSEGLPTQALVRFDHGSAKGNWYSFHNLIRLADFRGNPV